VLRGRVLIAPGNKHTLLERSGARYYVSVKDGPLVRATGRPWTSCSARRPARPAPTPSA
jgi:two-component system chemotaxis response regulator CheB